MGSHISLRVNLALASWVLTALIAGNVASAAVVPAGVQLAEKQTLVKNNGAEVQSLDPHKIEGVPEGNISRDLFEGLLISDIDGKPSPAWLRDGKVKILKSGLSIYAKMPNGLMETLSPRKTSSIVGSV